MNPFEMVVVIVLIVVIGRVLSSRYGSNAKKQSDDNMPVEYNNNTDSAYLQSEIKVLKERISVLERLATDDQRNLELDREIAKLRDSSKQ